MAVPKRKTTPMKRGFRRSHDKLPHSPYSSVCDVCQGPKQPHRVCPTCGTYKGRIVHRQKNFFKKLAARDMLQKISELP